MLPTQQERAEGVSMLDQLMTWCRDGKMGQAGQWLATLAGERTHFGSSRNDVTPFSADSLQATFEYGSLGHLLHYVAFDPGTRIFTNRGSQGFLLEASPLSGASEETVNIFSGLLLDVLPPSLDLQIMLWGSPHIGPVLNAFQETRSSKTSPEIYHWLAQKRMEWLASGVNQSLTRQGTFILRDFRLFLSVSVSVTGQQDRTEE